MTNYSYSKCPSCKSSQFEMVEETPNGSNFKLNFVRCASCQTVVGVREFHNISKLVFKLADALNVSMLRFV